MNSIFENKFSMFNTVITAKKQNPLAVDSVPAVKSNFLKFENKVAEIENIIKLQIKSTKGYTNLKKECTGILCESAVFVSSALYAFASSNDKPLVKDGSDFSPSDFGKMRDSILVENCRNIHKLATDNLTDLVPYNIDSSFLLQFQKEIDDTAQVNPIPTVEIKHRKVYTYQLAVLFQEATNILTNELDKTILLLKKTYSDFYKLYKNSRAIIDLKGKSNTIVSNDETITSAIIGFVYNEIDSSLIEDAVVEIEILEISDNTDEDGEYYLEKVPKGTYTIKASAPSYNQKEIPKVALADKEILSLDIYLTPSELPTVDETPEPE